MAHEKLAVEKGYRVTIDGIIVNKNGVRLYPRVGTKGYYSIGIRLGVKIIHIYVHRLQAYQMFGEEINNLGIQVRHLNGDSLDNRTVNISIGTASENQMDKPQNLRIWCAKNAASYIKKHDPVKIKQYHRESKSYKVTMQAFEITSKGTLHYILNH